MTFAGKGHLACFVTIAAGMADESARTVKVYALSHTKTSFRTDLALIPGITMKSVELLTQPSLHPQTAPQMMRHPEVLITNL